jgi:hypothetical protein
VYLAELRAGGEWPFVLDLHPRLTVVVGLGRERSHRLAGLVNGALCGRLEGVEGLVRVDGEEHGLTAELVAGLGIPTDIDVILGAGDLPGARVLEPEPEDPAPQPAPPPPEEEPEESAELVDARMALFQAREARAGGELALAAGRTTLDPDARAAMVAAETDLEATRRARDDAVERVRAAEVALDAARAEAAERRADVRADTDRRRSELEQRRQEVLAALAATSDTDPAPVAEALAELRRVESLPPGPVDEALALADAWAALQERRTTAPRPLTAPRSLVKAALETLEAARLDHTRAHEMARLADLTREDARNIEAAHAAVVEAAEKVEGARRPRPLARRRLEAAQAAEQQLLERLGLSSYHAFLLRAAPGLSMPVKQERLERANAALADAEAVWEELHAPVADDQQAQKLAAEADRLRAVAVTLLGGDPGADIEGALRVLRRAADPEPARHALLAALKAVGASPDAGGDPAASASAWLASSDEDHARRAALQAELGGLQSDLEELLADASGSERPDEGAEVSPAESSVTVHVYTRLEAELDEARAEFEAATDREQAAGRARNQASRRLENARSAELRVISLTEELAGAIAAHEQAAARVEELERTEVERRAASEAAAAPAPMRTAPEVDISGVDVDELEVYLLARLVAQRSVGEAGSLPFVIDDAFAGLPVDTTEKAIAVLERFTPAFQLIYLSDDPEIEEWARLFGPKGASVRRFLSAQSVSAT